MNYKRDEKKLGIVHAKEIIEKTLNKCCISDLKEEEKHIQKHFYELFVRERISIYHIEKILGIDHRRIRKILSE